MNLSYWEKKTWFSNIDFCVIGSGIVGLSCALQLRLDHPNSKIIILDKGVLPQGASTKNAGFACFGSASELLSDLEHQIPEEIQSLVKSRYDGLKRLRKILGDSNLDYKEYGGYEVFLEEDKELFEKCLSKIDIINELVEPVFGKNTFKVEKNRFQFKKCQNQIIFNPLEGQIDTGLMMFSLQQRVLNKNIAIINGVKVEDLEPTLNHVKIGLANFEFKARQVFVATNAFAGQFFDLDLKPARNQVVITKPIQNLNIKGVFHLKKGFYYFRNIDNRILLGGGRHLNLEEENTSEFGITIKIQNKLVDLLNQVIFPDKKIEIEDTWSGILGVGKTKTPIIKSIDDRLHCAVRLGGMGVAIGSNVGAQLSRLAL